MKIAEIRMIDEPADARGFQRLADFAVDVTPDVRIFSVTLNRAPDGNRFIRVPHKTAVAPTFRREILNKVLDTLDESAQHAA